MNRLSKEKSPYLQQHKHNPVNWFSWGEEAFSAARESNKPIFLSIGYSTCYWCHVMEQDSFEKDDVARALNDSFICIKVDREELPEVDSIYMDSVVAISGHGGWPMSVFLTPELQPFFGGTYFPRLQFLQILERVLDAWTNRRPDLLRSATELTDFIRKKSATIAENLPSEKEIFPLALQELKSKFDQRHGAFGTKPKFPPSMTLHLLLRINRRSGDVEALRMVRKTLDSMARGGIFDQIGGGFHRYSVDEKWLVPHFEKMLYDNALLSSLYLDAFQVTNDPAYAEVARNTLDYLIREMRDPQGGFYSAQDAGEVGREGEYYVWSADELRSILTPDELQRTTEVFGVSAQGNFEHGNNILHLQGGQSWAAKQGLSKISLKLLKQRETRKKPHLDDKVLTSWNGLTIHAFAKAANVLLDQKYLEAAEECANFLKLNLDRERKLKRRYRDSESAYDATLEDYAYLIQGLISLFECRSELSWLDWAIDLQQRQDQTLWDKNKGGYFFADPVDQSLIVAKKDFEDGAIPSANSISALNLLKLHSFTGDASMKEKAGEILRYALNDYHRYPQLLASALSAFDYYAGPAKEVIVVGNSTSTSQFKEFLRSHFLPNQVAVFCEAGDDILLEKLPLLRGKMALQGETTFYICESQSCHAPTNDIERAKDLVGR